MKRKLIGIFVMTLLIGTTILPVIGTMNTPSNVPTCQIGGPELEWEFITGGPYVDMIHAVYETEDEGFIAAGISEDPEGVFSGFVIKLDNTGNEIWRNIETEIQGIDRYSFGITEIQQTQDGGYIVLGACERIEDLKYGFLWKLNGEGETEWFNSAYSSQVSSNWYVVVPWDVIPVINGYIMVGGAWFLDDLYGSDIDTILMKTDLNGDVEWKQIYRYNEWYDEASVIASTLDGGYILGGTVNNFFYEVVTGPDDADIQLIKIDSDGNLEWQQTYGGPEHEWVFTKDLQQTTDGGYIINAMSASYNVNNPGRHWNIMLLKVDKDGNELWNKTYGERDDGDTSYSIDLTKDGGFIFCGHKNHGGIWAPKDSIWIVKTDDEGNIEWSQLYGGDETDRSYHIRQTSDDGFIVSGTTESFTVGGDWDGCILKFAAFDNNPPVKPEKPEGNSRGDPNTEYTFKSSSTDPDGNDLYYRWDWGDGELSDWIGPFDSGVKSEATHEWEERDNYEIRVKVKDEHGGVSDWSDPLPFSTPKNKITNLYHLILWRLNEKYPILKDLFEL
jgi:hypothetical protein